jgi:hypothetical protein
VRSQESKALIMVRVSQGFQPNLIPVPMLPVEGRGAFIRNGEVHTCRDFDRIREWV